VKNTVFFYTRNMNTCYIAHYKHNQSFKKPRKTKNASKITYIHFFIIDCKLQHHLFSHSVWNSLIKDPVSLNPSFPRACSTLIGQMAILLCTLIFETLQTFINSYRPVIHTWKVISEKSIHFKYIFKIYYFVFHRMFRTTCGWVNYDFFHFLSILFM